MRISVGIPTIAGREKYLASALKSCLAQEDPDLEIVVSDNSAGDAQGVVGSFADPRVRYIRPDTYLPMAAHWDFLVRHLTGDLVTIIGDDDGLMPGALHRVRSIVAAQGMHPVCHPLAQYGWPDYPDAQTRDKFWFVHAPGQEIHSVDSRAFLRDLCQARCKYIDGPAIYHNFIPRSVLDRLVIDGTIFHRSSPDLYSAITIAAFTDHFLVTGEVLTVSGVSARSNGAAYRDGRADGKRFMREMQEERYRPRYRSTPVQMHTLDSIQEASIRYQLPQLGEWLDRGAHFCSAANECLDIPSRARGARQLALVTFEAAREGLLARLLRDRGGGLLQKAKARMTGRPDDGVSDEAGYRPGRRFDAPREVTDVHSAAVYLAGLLGQAGS